MVTLRARGSPKSRFPESRVSKLENYHKKRGILLEINLSRISQWYYIKIVLERTKMNAKTRQKSDILISGIWDSRNLVMCQVFSFLGSDMQKLTICRNCRFWGPIFLLAWGLGRRQARSAARRLHVRPRAVPTCRAAACSTVQWPGTNAAAWSAWVALLHAVLLRRSPPHHWRDC